MAVSTPVVVCPASFDHPRYSARSKELPGITYVGGSLYWLLWDETQGVDMFKSTDSGATWAIQDHAGSPWNALTTPVYMGCACYGGGKFHYIYNDYENDKTFYQTFDPATDTWSEATDLALESHGYDDTNMSMRCVYRSDGTIVFSYRDSSYVANLAVLTDGAVTSSAIAVDAGNVAFDQMLVDDNDVVHILWYDVTPYRFYNANRYLRHKSWDGDIFSATTNAIDNQGPTGYASGLYFRVGLAAIHGNTLVIPFGKETAYWSYTYSNPGYYDETFPSNCVIAVSYTESLTPPSWHSVEVTDDSDGETKRPTIIPTYNNGYAPAAVYCESKWQVYWCSEYQLFGYYAYWDPPVPRFYNYIYRCTSTDLATWTDPEQVFDSRYFDDALIVPPTAEGRDYFFHAATVTPIVTDAGGQGLGALVGFSGPLVVDADLSVVSYHLGASFAVHDVTAANFAFFGSGRGARTTNGFGFFV